MLRAVTATFAVLLTSGHALAAQAGPDAGSVLARPVSLSVREASLADALGRLRLEGGVPLAFSGDILPAAARVSVSLRDQPLGLVLAAVLAGTGLDVVVTRDGSVVVVQRRPTAPEPGAFLGRALDLTATGVRQLDEVIVMGSAVAAAPGREQPTAVSVAGPAELTGAAHTRIGDLVRTLLPGVVLWDAGPGGGPPRVTSVRGVSSFTHRGLKSYVDGVEVAASDFFPLVDGRAIERLEVIRGPQGAALYGPDALNGILQVETRAGRLGGPPRVAKLFATAGIHEPGGGGAATLWQDHAGAVAAAGARWAVELSGNWSRAGEDGQDTWHQVRGVHGGASAQAGPVLVRATGRAGDYAYATTRPSGAPVVVPQEVGEVAAGVSLLHAIHPRWSQTLAFGYHRGSGPRDPFRSFVLDPLLPLGATHERASRKGVRYGTALDLGAATRPATISAGVEHSARQLERSVRRQPTGPDLAVLYRDDLRSTGGFGQLRARVGPRLVATVGARAEWSSSVGNGGGATWATTAGASWSQPVGGSMLRLRTAWGRALRPPEPGMSRTMATATVLQEANDALAPERQAGLEFGLDFYHAGGAWLRMTAYHQIADELIQQVRIRTAGAVRTFQYQNVGAIRNRGLELEGGARLGGLEVAGTMHWTDSEVRRIAVGYTGALQAGDPMLEVPGSAGSLLARYVSGPWTAEAGLSWLGGWVGYDRVAAIEAEAAPLASARTPREYWMEYPAAARPHLALAFDAGRGVGAFLRADNPGASARFLRDNLSPRLGRTTMVGVTIQR